MLDALSWLVTQIGLGFYNLFFAVTHPSLWLDWSDKEALMRFVYYGASVEFFFVVFDIFLVVTLIGLIFRPFMWACVRGLEGFANATALEANGLSWRPDAPFDRLYEQTFLCAIHPRDREAYAQMAFEVLKPGGQLLVLFMQKDERGGPPYGCSIPAMKTLFSEARWIWPEAESLTLFPHPRLNDKAELASVLTRR